MWPNLEILSLWALCALAIPIFLPAAQAQIADGVEAVLKGNVIEEDDITTTPLPEPAEFTVYDRAGMPCILVRMDTTLIIEPKRTTGKKTFVKVPKSAESSGSCGTGEDSKIVLSWRSFRFLLHFQKSRVSDAWYVDYIELSYNTSDKAFGNTTQGVPGMMQIIHSSDPLTLYLTPIGRAYGCERAKDIKLYDDKKFARVTISLSRFKVQPFAEMTHRQFGDDFKCPEEAGRRDETVPFAVAGVLALSVLGTIAGYGGYRYFKVKKIEYDTME